MPVIRRQHRAIVILKIEMIEKKKLGERLTSAFAAYLATSS